MPYQPPFEQRSTIPWFVVVMAMLLAGLVVPSLHGQDDAQEKVNPTNLAEMREQIKLASQEFKAEKFEASALRLERCIQCFESLVLQSDRKELSEWERVHRQLGNATEALAIQGAELPGLPDWKTLQGKIRESAKGKTEKEGSPAMATDAVSFSKDVVPILVENCGRCHVDKASGEFAMATYEQLIKGSKAGVVLFPGDPISSPLVSLMESGQMPPNGNRVPAAKLNVVKTWIEQGAKLDTNDPKAPIKSLLPTGDSPKPPEKMTEVKERTGKETVSFSSDIAPLLVANCNGCHYVPANVRGGLRLSNFNELLKGGDSGAIIVPGQADDSLFVKKLLGTEGQRMPAGRPPLTDAQITVVKTWINEGATFDGEGKDARLDTVIAKSFAANASHVELMQRRVESARAKWQIVAPKSKPDEAADEEWHVIGNIGKASTEKLLAQVQVASKNLKRQLKLSPKDPLIKGGIVLFAFKSRYEYGEMGKMLEKRTLPPEWSAHWRKETPDLYIAMVYEPSEPKINESTLASQLMSVWIASRDGSPKWFSEGAGRNALATIAGMNDARVQPWVRRFPEIVNDLKNIQPVKDEKMNDEDVAILGFGIIRQMQSGPLKSKYEAFLKQLAGTQAFEETFVKNFGPVDAFLKQALGKP